jgi:hypothetical protein
MDSVELLTAIGVEDGFRTDASISDPRTCGEDVVANLDHLAAFAEDHCVRCFGYHAWHGLDRVVRKKTGIDNDRPDLIDMLRGIIASIAETNRTDRIDLVIPGSADTAILSTCAHAAWSLGAEISSRIRYTVLDLCETPLSLCRVYAKRYGLAVQTLRTDFNEPLPLLPADIIVLHSILSFISPVRHVDFMHELGRMLTPSGRMIVSNRLRTEQAPKRAPQDFALLLQEAMKSGKVKPTVPVEKIMSGVTSRHTGVHEFTSDEEMRAIFAGAGLKVESTTMVAKIRERPTALKQQYTVRHISVLYA